MALGLVLFRGAPIHAHYVSDLLPAMVLLGIGAGVAFPSLMTLAMSAATAEDSGLASGLVNTTQQVGGALGLAVLATLASTRTNTLRHDGSSVASSLTSGYHLAFTIGAVLLIAAIASGREPAARSERAARGGRGAPRGDRARGSRLGRLSGRGHRRQQSALRAAGKPSPRGDCSSRERSTLSS